MFTYDYSQYPLELFERLFYAEIGVFYFLTGVTIFLVHRNRHQLESSGVQNAGMFLYLGIPLGPLALAIAGTIMAVYFNNSRSTECIQGNYILEILGSGILMICCLESYRVNSPYGWDHVMMYVLMAAVIPSMALFISAAYQYPVYHSQIGSYIFGAVSAAVFLASVVVLVVRVHRSWVLSVLVLATATVLLGDAAYKLYMTYYGAETFFRLPWQMFLALVIVVKVLVVALLLAIVVKLKGLLGMVW